MRIDDRYCILEATVEDIDEFLNILSEEEFICSFIKTATDEKYNQCYSVVAYRNGYLFHEVSGSVTKVYEALAKEFIYTFESFILGKGD